MLALYMWHILDEYSNTTIITVVAEDEETAREFARQDFIKCNGRNPPEDEIALPPMYTTWVKVGAVASITV